MASTVSVDLTVTAPGNQKGCAGRALVVGDPVAGSLVREEDGG